MSQIIEIDQILTEERLKLSKVEKALDATISLFTDKATATLALRSVQKSSMWLGKCKGAIGIKTPYTKSFDPESNVIEDRADTTEDVFDTRNIDEVAFIKMIRVELNKIEGSIYSATPVFKDIPKYQIAIHEAFKNACEATMWLGMSLNSIKNKPNEKDL